jgi:hypothetical protein
MPSGIGPLGGCLDLGVHELLQLVEFLGWKFAAGVAGCPPAAHQLFQALALGHREETVGPEVADDEKRPALVFREPDRQGVDRLARCSTGRLSDSDDRAIGCLVGPRSLAENRDPRHPHPFADAVRNSSHSPQLEIFFPEEPWQTGFPRGRDVEGWVHPVSWDKIRTRERFAQFSPSVNNGAVA